MATQDVNIRLKIKAAEAKKALGDLTNSVSGIADANKQVLKVSSVAFAAMAGGLTLAAVEAGKFDDKMRSVKTLLDDDAFAGVGKSLNEGFADLKTGTLQVLSEIPIESEAATKSLFDLVSAGVDVTKANEALATSGKLAVAGLTDVSTATDGITSALNAYGLEADQADSIAAKFFAAQKKGKTTIAELADGFGKVGATASNLGVSFDEVLSSVSTLTLGGVKTAEAYTSLNAIMTGIAKPTAEAAAESKRLGLSFDLASLQSKGLAGFLEDLSSNQKFTKESATKLFGSVEAVKGIFALTSKDGAKFKEILGDIGDETKALTTFNKAYATQSKSLPNQIKLFTNQVKGLVVQLGERLQPILEKIVGFGNRVLKFFNDLDEGTKDIIAGIAIFATAAAGVITAITGIALAVGSVIAIWPTLVAGFAALSAALPVIIGAIGAAATAFGALAIAILTNPIVLAIAGIVGAIVLMKKAFDENLFGIQEIFAGVVAALKVIWDTFFNTAILAVQFFAQGVMSIVNPIVDFFASIISEIAELWTENYDTIVEVTTTAFDTVKGIVQTVLDFYIDFWTTVIGYALDFLDTLASFIPGFKGIKASAKELGDEIADAFKKASDEKNALLKADRAASKKDAQGQLEDEKAFLRRRNVERNKATVESNQKEIAERKKLSDARKQAAEKDAEVAAEIKDKRAEEAFDNEISYITESRLAYASSQEEVASLLNEAFTVAEAQHKAKLAQIEAEKGKTLEAIELKKNAEMEYQRVQQGIAQAGQAATTNVSKADEAESAAASAEVSAIIDTSLSLLGEGLEETFEGLAGALSGALLDGLGDSISSIGGIPAQFAEAGNNFARTIVDTADASAQAVEQIPQIIDTIIGTFKTVFPKLVDSFVKAIPKIVKGLAKLAPVLVKGIAKAIPTVLRAVLSALPELIGLLPELFDELLKGLANAFEVILQELPNIILALFDALPKLFKSIVDIIPDFIEKFADNIGPIIESLVEGILTAIPEIVIALVDSLLLEGGLERIVGALIRAMPRIAVALVVGFAKAIQNLIGNIGGSLGAALLQGIGKNIGAIGGQFGEMFKKQLMIAFNAPINRFKKDIEIFKRIVDFFKNAIDSLREIPQKIKDAVNNLNPFKSGGGGGGVVSNAIGVNVGFEKGTKAVPRYLANGLDFITRAPKFPNRNTDTVDIKAAVGERIFSVPENRDIIDAMRKGGGGGVTNIRLHISPPEFARMVDQAIVENSTLGIGAVQVAVGSEE
jgi:TP901 family phage tail tape measure protein